MALLEPPTGHARITSGTKLVAESIAEQDVRKTCEITPRKTLMQSMRGLDALAQTDFSQIDSLAPSKYISAAEKETRGLNDSDWKPPLQRHKDVWGEVAFLTIRIRIVSGDSDHDFNARFPADQMTAGLVCSAIAAKERLQPREFPLFSIWIISKDLELQIRPSEDLYDIASNWNSWVLKYTHFPQAANPDDPVNHFWFVYRREAAVTIKEEISFMRESAQLLCYGQAKYNHLCSRYVSSFKDTAALAAAILQGTKGDYSEYICPPGYLLSNEILTTLMPLHFIDRLKPKEWEDLIIERYKDLRGCKPVVARQAFLSIVRKWDSYGCSFFPACAEIPPSGFFEYRTQNWAIGVGPNGFVIIDYDANVNLIIKF